MDHHHGFVVEPELQRAFHEDVLRPGIRRQFGLFSAHALHDAFVPRNLSIGRHAIAVDEPPRPIQRQVATGIVGIGTGIQDHAQGPVGDSGKCCEHCVTGAGVTSIDQQHTLITHLRGDISARAEQHINSLAQLHGADGHRRGRCLVCAGIAGTRRFTCGDDCSANEGEQCR